MEATRHNLEILTGINDRAFCDDNITEPPPGEDTRLAVFGVGQMTPRDSMNWLADLVYELADSEVADISPTKTGLILAHAKALHRFAKEMENQQG